MLSLLQFIILSAICGISKCGQKAILYDGYDQSGEQLVIEQNSISNLADEGFDFDNRAFSACVTGLWIFYQDTNFHPTGGRDVEYMFGNDNQCENLQQLNGSISSLKLVGDPTDITVDSFTLYQYDYFQGLEESTFDQIPSLNLTGDHQSIIITGKTDWAVFDEPDFKGIGVCLTATDPTSGTPTFIRNIQTEVDPPIPYGAIRSVRKGCEGVSAVEGREAYEKKEGGCSHKSRDQRMEDENMWQNADYAGYDDDQ